MATGTSTSTRSFFGSFTTLHWALTISVLVHATLLTIRFVDPQAFDRIFEDTPLEVILVNAKSEQNPDKAQAIAQAALAGGGEAEQGRASTPLPYSAMTSRGDALEDEQRTIDAMEQQQERLLTAVREQLAALPEQTPQNNGQEPQVAAQQEKRRQLLKLLAEIERRIQEENARPKKRYVSPATREAVYAIYYDQLRRKVEDKGTANFPEHKGQKLYGELTMLLTINHDGSLLATEIRESSGNRNLDRRAEAIARGAAPFGAFNDEMRQKADQIAVVSRFRFSRDETLQTRQMANTP